MTSVGLCMVVYNESKVILRCLESVTPIIDYYIIIDTGSNDDTKNIIKQFADKNNIKGEVYDGDEFNMSKNLNFIFNKLKSITDIGFYIDADNIISIPDKLDILKFKNELSFNDIGIVSVKKEDNQYGKRLFYNLKNNWTWNGVIHEVATQDHEYSIKPYYTPLNLIIHNDGNSWTSQTQKEKYLRHVKIILNDIEKNGITSRNVFYLAQSYRDAGEKEEAIKWYSARLSMVGFTEELYVSQLNIAILKWQLCKPVSEIADEFMKCNELDELRAEHLYYLKQMYERNSRLKSAIKIKKLLTEYFDKNPYPQRVLFINPIAYKAID